MDEDEARKIREAVLARNTLRAGASLPFIDVEEETRKAIAHAEGKAAWERYEKLREVHSEHYKCIREEIITRAHESGNTTYPNGFFGRYQLHTLTEQKFREFLRTLDDQQEP